MTTSKPRTNVIVLALMQERHLYDNYSQLFDSMRSVAIVSLVETKSDFSRKLKLTKPAAIVAIDSAISDHENNDVLTQLVRFTKGGGVVVCCCNFSNHFNYSQARQYFSTWGLPWDAGSYLRTTVHRNRNSDSLAGMSLDGLPVSYSIKSLLLLHVPTHQAVYNPSSSSRIESRVFASDLFPVDPTETPCAYAAVGRGYFGYVGDVNNEDGSTRVVIAMCHFPQNAVLPDTAEPHYGVEVLPGGGFAKAAPSGDPNKFVMFSDAIRQAGRDVQSGCRMGTEGETVTRSGTSTSASPPSSNNASSSSDVPPPTPTTRNPPRPREAEVEARALTRAANSKRKMNEAEGFKEQGNTLFRQGDNLGAIRLYERAIAIRGPRPTYQANIAAAYLKLNMYLEAEAACEEALKHDPKHLKARFRRGLARLAMHHFKDALKDFMACTKLAPQDPQFPNQMLRTRKEYIALKATGYQDHRMSGQDIPIEPGEEIGDLTHFDPALDDFPVEILSDSDSSDFERDGNGTPCRFYNHDGCRNGSKCKFKHAPTRQRTTRDELGRNVCNFWLLGECKFGDKCLYAHSKEYLPDVRIGSRPAGKNLESKGAMDNSTVRGGGAGESQRPVVMLLSLANEDFFASIHGHLLSALHAVAEVSHVLTSDSALRHLSGSGLHAVFVTDSGISERKNAKVLSALVKYAKSGGTVVIGAMFSSFITDMDKFFRHGWGVPWRQGSYHRTTFSANSSFFDSDTFNAKQVLPQSYCIKAVHLKEMRPEDAVYIPTQESRLQSAVFSPCAITELDESPVVYARFGNGYLGYNGDVNGEQESTNVILAMLRLP